MTFRRRLLLAMLFITFGLTVATLGITQRIVASTTDALIAERFASDARMAIALQDTRLAAVSARCRELAASVRLVAAFGEHDTSLLYDIAIDELRDVLRPSGRDEARVPATFFRLLDAAGHVLPPTDERAGILDDRAEPAWIDGIAAAGRSLGTQPGAIGYLPRGLGDAAVLDEIILTRVVDPVDARTLGVLAIGFPVMDVLALTPESGPSHHGGILVGTRLFATRLPPLDRAAVAQAAATIRDHGHVRGRGDVIALDHVPHRVLIQPIHPASPFPPVHQVAVYSAADALARQRRLRDLLAAIGIAAAAVGYAFSRRIAGTLAQPINDLVAGAARVQSGTLDVAVPVRGDDELGRLTRAFNDMTAGLVQKERYRRLLDVVADPAVAEALVTSGSALGGELTDVTVLFCDIRGFTSLTADLDPRDVITLVNDHMTALTRVVHAHGGVVDKFVGDAVMALFGAPQRRGDDARRAVAAAQQMIAVRAALDRTARQPLAIGIGIATGSVVAGCVGAQERASYTVLGARVNLAARLAGRAGRGEILIDDATRAHLDPSVAVAPGDDLALKGFAEAVRAYRLGGST